MRMSKLSKNIKKTNRLVIAISDVEKTKLEKVAAIKDISMSAIGRIAIREYIEKETK